MSVEFAFQSVMVNLIAILELVFLNTPFTNSNKNNVFPHYLETGHDILPDDFGTADIFIFIPQGVYWTFQTLERLTFESGLIKP